MYVCIIKIKPYMMSDRCCVTGCRLTTETHLWVKDTSRKGWRRREDSLNVSGSTARMGSRTADERESETGTTIRLSLFPECGWNVISCRSPLPPCLPHRDRLCSQNCETNKPDPFFLELCLSHISTSTHTHTMFIACIFFISTFHIGSESLHNLPKA